AVGLNNIHQDTIEEIRLIVEPSENTSFVFYEDDGESNNYKNGDYRKTVIQIASGTETVITFQPEGSYQSPVKRMVVELLCQEIAPVEVELHGNKLPMYLGKQEWEA